MDIQSVPPSRPEYVPPRPERVLRAAPESTPGGQGPVADAAPSSAPIVTPPEVRVQVERSEAGVQTVTVYDTRTGQPIFEMPPHQVVEIIDEALRRAAEGRSDGR